jgi:hypothetical protein
MTDPQRDPAAAMRSLLQQLGRQALRERPGGENSPLEAGLRMLGGLSGSDAVAPGLQRLMPPGSGLNQVLDQARGEGQQQLMDQLREQDIAIDGIDQQPRE